MGKVAPAPWMPSVPVYATSPPPRYEETVEVDPEQFTWVPESRMDKFRALCQDNEISDFFAAKLRQLEGFDIVLIGDDSGSMRAPISQTNAFAPPMTRWDELKSSVSLIVSLASILNEDGCDLFFLNRPPVLAVKDPSQIEASFASRPTGFTPITPVLNHILDVKLNSMHERNLLVIILTDGQPTDEAGNVNIMALEQLLIFRPEAAFITFVACTDDLSVMSYLNSWDCGIARLDVVDDFVSERREILAAQGPLFHFSHGDYIVKLMLGSIDPSMDKLDEVPRVRGRANTAQSQRARPKKEKYKRPERRMTIIDQSAACCAIS